MYLNHLDTYSVYEYGQELPRALTWVGESVTLPPVEWPSDLEIPYFHTCTYYFSHGYIGYINCAWQIQSSSIGLLRYTW